MTIFAVKVDIKRKRFLDKPVVTGVGNLSYRKPPPEGGGGTALAVTEGGKKCSLLLFLSLEDSG
ncbi:MAG: hypothetical protein ACI4HZ_01965, partial [Ruminococcus sp.]